MVGLLVRARDASSCLGEEEVENRSGRYAKGGELESGCGARGGELESGR